MAGTNRSARSVASVSRTCSMSSRNLRNMIQVSIGSLSRSPLRPLSFRMMSLADLITEASCWAVEVALLTVLWAMLSPLGGVEERLKLGDSIRQRLRSAELVCDLY